jgi:hypothetical protein
MNEIVSAFAPYGLPGAILLLVGWLVWKLLDEGFLLEVGTKRRANRRNQ